MQSFLLYIVSDHGSTDAGLLELVLVFDWDDLVEVVDVVLDGLADFVDVVLVEVVLVVVLVDLGVGTDLVALVDMALVVDGVSLLATSCWTDLVVLVDIVVFFDEAVLLLGWVPVDTENAVVA